MNYVKIYFVLKYFFDTIVFAFVINLSYVRLFFKTFELLPADGRYVAIFLKNEIKFLIIFRLVEHICRVNILIKRSLIVLNNTIFYCLTLKFMTNQWFKKLSNGQLSRKQSYTNNCLCATLFAKHKTNAKCLEEQDYTSYYNKLTSDDRAANKELSM